MWISAFYVFLGMDNLSKLDQYYLYVKSNRWYWLFSIFCRLSLAFAFIVAGFVKIIGERFASGLSVLHPMGAYLEALHHTGFYYTFIGYAQVAAAILLVIPRTVFLGALIYFPIILNICVLSIAVRFEGSLVTAPLMVLANLFLLMWHFDKLQFLLPIKARIELLHPIHNKKSWSNFPWFFGSFVILTVVLTVAYAEFGYKIMPRNSLKDCKKQFVNTINEEKGIEFCQCIHINGSTLDQCLEEYNNKH
jgi:hypothetical protein